MGRLAKAEKAAQRRKFDEELERARGRAVEDVKILNADISRAAKFGIDNRSNNQQYLRLHDAPTTKLGPSATKPVFSLQMVKMELSEQNLNLNQNLPKDELLSASQESGRTVKVGGTDWVTRSAAKYRASGHLIAKGGRWSGSNNLKIRENTSTGNECQPSLGKEDEALKQQGEDSRSSNSSHSSGSSDSSNSSGGDSADSDSSVSSDSS